MKKIFFFCILLVLFLTGCNSNSSKNSLDYLLVRFEGEENWSLLDAAGKVLARNELVSHRVPTMVKEEFFIADSGYYHVSNLKSPAFYSPAMISGTLFDNGAAIVVNKYEEGDKYFSVIDYKGNMNKEYDVFASESATTPTHGFCYTYDKQSGVKIVASMKGITENPKGNVILGEGLTGTSYDKLDERGREIWGEQVFRAFRGDRLDYEIVWETEDNLLNFKECHKTGYLIKQSDDNHMVILDMNLNELFSHPDAYVNKYNCKGVAYLDNMVIYCNDEPSVYGKYGLMTTDGTILLEPQFNKLIHLSDNIFLGDFAYDDEYEGMGFLINEKGEKISEEKIDLLSTRQFARDNYIKLGKYFILSGQEKENGFLFIDSEGKRLELPAVVEYIGCGDSKAEERPFHLDAFKKREN